MKVLIGIIAIILLVMLLRAGELYTQLARYQKYWTKVNDTPIGKNDLVYIAFGDSAAQGVGASKPAKGYVGLVAAELSKRQDKPVHVINLSKSGAKISDVLDTQLPAYARMDISNQKVFTIEIGANDILSFDENKFRKEMDELMGSLPQGTIMSDLPSFKGSRLAKHDGTVVKANKIMYELADKHGFGLAPLYKQVEGNHGFRTFGGDFFHPSDYGYSTNWLPVFSSRLNSDNRVL